jgi:hypothetical protein
MPNLLSDEIVSFTARDFADWISSGFLFYSGTNPLPKDMRVADSFPYAKLFIGRNEGDLPEDLKDVFHALPHNLRVKFQHGIVISWNSLEFREVYEFKFAENLLVLACRVRAKVIVDSLPNALPWLAASSAAGQEFAALALRIRRRSFQASLELASSSTESVLSVQSFLIDDAFDEPVVELGESVAILEYLASNAKDRLPYWLAIFGNIVVSDVQEGSVSVEEVRSRLEVAYGKDQVQRVVDLVRIDQIARLATEREALSSESMNGLYNLISAIDSKNAGGGQWRQSVTLDWNNLQGRPLTRTAEVIDLAEWRA